jgi:hypothetical protein
MSQGEGIGGGIELGLHPDWRGCMGSRVRQADSQVRQSEEAETREIDDEKMMAREEQGGDKEFMLEGDRAGFGRDADKAEWPKLRYKAASEDRGGNALLSDTLRSQFAALISRPPAAAPGKISCVPVRSDGRIISAVRLGLLSSSIMSVYLAPFVNIFESSLPHSCSQPKPYRSIT